MCQKKNKRAFTLIELLVVVLIIGILSAVALPQYTKTVERARMAEAVTNLNALRKAVEVAKLANPGETITEDMLDIDIASWENDKWKYMLKDQMVLACRKSADFGCTNLPASMLSGILTNATGISLSEASACRQGTGPCPTTCYGAGGGKASNSASGMYGLVALENGKICCGATSASTTGISICKNFNAQ